MHDPIMLKLTQDKLQRGVYPYTLKEVRNVMEAYKDARVALCSICGARKCGDCEFKENAK